MRSFRVVLQCRVKVFKCFEIHLNITSLPYSLDITVIVLFGPGLVVTALTSNR